MSKCVLFLLALGLASSSFADATVLTPLIIDFETTPGGATPVDNAVLGLNDGYSVGGFTITFGLDIDGDGTPETPAVFEQIGENPPDGFTNGCLPNRDRDIAAPGFESQLGNFFLRGSEAFMDFGQLVIDYSGAGTVTAASGEIWDIDSFSMEQYRVRAFGSGGVLLATIDSPLGMDSCPGPLNAMPWKFEFLDLSAGITRITIDFIGSRTEGIGVAFNNFDALGVTVATEPTSWGMLKRKFEIE